MRVDLIETCDAATALEREMSFLGEAAEDPLCRRVWFWEAQTCLVAPRNLASLPQFSEAQRDMEQRGWPVFVRGTGGDVTPQGPGIVNVTHVYARSSGGPVDLEVEYGRLCKPIAETLGQGASIGWQSGAFCDGAYNVQFEGRKFAGTAMRFRPCKHDKTRFAILAHALMLFEPPTNEMIDALNRFLEVMEQPRRIDFAAHTGLPRAMARDEFVRDLAGAFHSLEV